VRAASRQCKSPEANPPFTSPASISAKFAVPPAAAIRDHRLYSARGCLFEVVVDLVEQLL
jgi:hypothetical protein